MLTKVQGAESTGLVLATKELAAKKLRAKKDKIFKIDECVGLFILLFPLIDLVEPHSSGAAFRSSLAGDCSAFLYSMNSHESGSP